MSDDKNAPNSIEQFLYGKESERDQDEMNERNYRLTSEKPRRMVRLVREDGSFYSVHYADIFTLEGNPTGEYLSVILRGGMMWHLEGKNLHRLADAIEDFRAARLYVYDSALHQEGNASDPVITRISEKLPAKKPVLVDTSPGGQRDKVTA